MQEVKPSVTDVYLIWGSGPGHLSPVRTCCPSTVLLGILQHGKSKTGQVFIPRSRSRSTHQTGTCSGKYQGSILFRLCLVWIKSPHLPPSRILTRSPHPKTSFFLPCLFLFVQLHQVASIRAHRTGKHCRGLSLQVTHKGQTQGEKNIGSWKIMNWKICFPTRTSWAASSIYKMKHKMCFFLLTNTAAHVCSDLFQASVLIRGKSQLCVGVSGMIQQRNTHSWKMYHAYGKSKGCIPLSSQATEISLFVFTLTHNAVLLIAETSCSFHWCRGSIMQSVLSRKHHTTAWKYWCLCMLYYFHWTASHFSTAKEGDNSSLVTYTWQLMFP